VPLPSSPLEHGMARREQKKTTTARRSARHVLTREIYVHARTKPQGTVKIGAGITGLVFFREFDLFWYKDGILIDVCFGEPPWRFDGLSLTLRLFRDTLIIVPEDLGLPGALLPYVCASNFPPVICWEYMLSVEEVDLQYKEIFVLLDWDALGSENSLEFIGHQG
ncbi:unnamed protein product, partial [Musa banksii]